MTPDEFDAWEREQEREREARRAAAVHHIRAKLPKNRGNQWYKDRSEYVPQTLCGAEVTEFDIGYGSARSKWAQANACRDCVQAVPA